MLLKVHYLFNVIKSSKCFAKFFYYKLKIIKKTVFRGLQFSKRTTLLIQIILILKIRNIKKKLFHFKSGKIEE